MRAGQFADRIFTLLLASQIVLLAVALIFTPAVIEVLAPGFSRDPGRFTLAVELTRITFPYLLLITLVTLYGGILNALQRFAAAAAAPILLNMSLMLALALAAFFPTPATLPRGACSLPAFSILLVAGDAGLAGVLPRFRWPELDADVRRFSARWGLPFLAQLAYNWRCSRTPSLRASCPQAHCLLFIMQIVSTSCRSASLVSPRGPPFFPRCRVELRMEITMAPGKRKIA